MLLIALLVFGAAAQPLAAPPPPPVIVTMPAPSKPAIAPLPAIGAWTAVADNGLCTLQRVFRGGSMVALLSIMPWPLSARTEITVVTDGDGPDAARGSGRLVSDDGGRAEGRLNASALALSARHFGRGRLYLGEAAAVEGGVATGIAPALAEDDIGLRVTTIDLPVAMPTLTEGTLLAIESEVVETPSIALRDVADANAKLKNCQDAQLTGWGIDPEEATRIATPATPGASGVTAWYSSNNYPKSALKAGEQGIVIFRWRIGVDGRTSDCAPVQSSGSAALDEGACAVILNHRFSSPALDGSGRPMVSHGMRRIAWRLPGG